MNIIILDTEGTNKVKAASGNIAETALVYDIGWIVADKKTGEVLDKYSFVNTDIFYRHDLMKNAYYAEKLPQYHKGLGEEWIPLSFLSIKKIFANVCRDYQVKQIWAYNVRYDRTALNNTCAELSNGFVEFFTPYGIKWCDIWDFAGKSLCSTSKFIKWTIENGFITPKGNPQTSAEVVYRYITQNKEFVENHTALEDCEIEHSILRACLKRREAQPKTMGNGWRYAANKKKSMDKN